MENSSSSNDTTNFGPCVLGPYHGAALSTIDIVTILMGQPVVARLLWVASTSKTTDILNCNLALFHNVQYLISFLHLSVLFVLSGLQQKILKFLFVYVETGGPMSLTFICLERYVAVVHPTSYPLLKTYRCREVCSAVVWLLSIPAAFASVFTSSFQGESLVQSLPFVTMVAMITLNIWCSSKIARALKKSGPAGRDELHPVKRRALVTVRATALITFFFYIPVTWMQRFDYVETLSCALTPVGILFLSAASMVHPLLYLYTHGKLFTC